MNNPRKVSTVIEPRSGRFARETLNATECGILECKLMKIRLPSYREHVPG